MERKPVIVETLLDGRHTDSPLHHKNVRQQKLTYYTLFV